MIKFLRKSFILLDIDIIFMTKRCKNNDVLLSSHWQQIQLHYASPDHQLSLLEDQN